MTLEALFTGTVVLDIWAAAFNVITLASNDQHRPVRLGFFSVVFFFGKSTGRLEYPS
jgi:hypothetical protein